MLKEKRALPHGGGESKDPRRRESRGEKWEMNKWLS